MNNPSTIREHMRPEKAEATANWKMRDQMHRLVNATDHIVEATGQAFYVWDIPTDEIEWSRNFRTLVGLKEDESRHLKGRKFESMLGSQSKETRFGVIVSSDQKASSGKPVPYQCVYLFQPDVEANTAPLWIEDTGCWFPSPEGRPMRAEGSIRVINDRRQREDDLRRQSDFDDLTGLPNRRSLEKQLTKAIEYAAREGAVSTFMILSIDRMNLINDIHGFETGDFVLKRIGEIICSRLRADDIVCRFSGAKFGVILKDCPPAEIYDAGNRLLSAISEEVIKTDNGMIAANGVIGACFLPRHAETAHQAIHAAFKAARNARTEAARRVSVYSEDAELRAKFRAKAQFSNDVIKAIEDNRIELAFQPVCRKQGDIAFHEALVRLKGTDGKISVAGNFIGIAEELGLIRIVDKHTLSLVLQALKDYPDAVISINISQDTVLDPDWLSSLATGLVPIKNGAKRLIVEITESLAVTDLEETKRFLENINALGCRVAIDDFGAGFTSFSNLKELPVDIIKIDGRFGLNLSANEENQAFVKALLALAKVFDIETVVEWVEDKPTSDLLEDWKVDYQQGHQFGRPKSELPYTKIEQND
ncbi:MAG: EAL domain-containing protein [Salaquimonas sp.]